MNLLQRTHAVRKKEPGSQVSVIAKQPPLAERARSLSELRPVIAEANEKIEAASKFWLSSGQFVHAAGNCMFAAQYYSSNIAGALRASGFGKEAERADGISKSLSGTASALNNAQRGKDELQLLYRICSVRQQADSFALAVLRLADSFALDCPGSRAGAFLPGHQEKLETLNFHLKWQKKSLACKKLLLKALGGQEKMDAPLAAVFKREEEQLLEAAKRIVETIPKVEYRALRKAERLPNRVIKIGFAAACTGLLAQFLAPTVISPDLSFGVVILGVAIGFRGIGMGLLRLKYSDAMDTIEKAGKINARPGIAADARKLGRL